MTKRLLASLAIAAAAAAAAVTFSVPAQAAAPTQSGQSYVAQSAYPNWWCPAHLCHDS